MKRILQIAVLLTAFYSCKKNDAVDKKELISSNVAQYTFGEQDFVSGFKILSIPTTKDTADNSAWFVYLYHQAIDRWYLVPGLGNGGSTNYRISYDFKNDHINIYIDKASGPGEKYAKARVIRVYNRNQQMLGRLKDDHEAVMEMVINGK